MFALPLQWGRINLGVLDLYRLTPGPLRHCELTSAVNAADTAAAMLALGMHADPDNEPVWDRSWGDRVEIHQATAMVAAQLQVSAADAISRLRGHAFTTDRLLPDVAADVIARRLRFTPNL